MHYVYIVPEDYNVSPRYQYSFPPRVVAFVNHNNEFIGVGLCEKPTNWTQSETPSEVRLPEDVLTKIMRIMLNDESPYKYNGKIDLIETNSLELNNNWYY